MDVTKEDKKKKNHEHYLKHKEYFRSYERRHYKEDAEWRKKKLLQTKNKVTWWRNNAINKLGGCCLKCGFLDIRALQIDHVNGGGRIDRNGLMTGFYKKVINDRDGKYQLLCANCNVIKKIEKNEY